MNTLSMFSCFLLLLFPSFLVTDELLLVCAGPTPNNNVYLELHLDMDSIHNSRAIHSH
jgi:hypothetical protein